jgi:hypothetical protein
VVADGWSTTAANAALDSWAGTYDWIQMHVGSPGSAGTTNGATETTRQQVTWGSATGAVLASSADLTWTSVAGSETYTHFSAWTASSGGTFGGSGAVTANAVTAGDDFTAASGDVTMTLPTAS